MPTLPSPSCQTGLNWFKKRKFSRDINVVDCLPSLSLPDYYTLPSIEELAKREGTDPGYCSRVPDFVVGRVGFGYITFLGPTDVRWLDLDKIVKFDLHSAAVYEKEKEKPPVGYGLNKSAEVMLIVQPQSPTFMNLKPNEFLINLMNCTASQGAQFISFDSSSGEWRFKVEHFSRFGLIEDEDDDDVVMNEPIMANNRESDPHLHQQELALPHSLPAHLGLDPVRMKEMRMLLFPAEAEDKNIYDPFPPERRHLRREGMSGDSPSSSSKSHVLRHKLQNSFGKNSNKTDSSPLKKAPVALLEYNVNSPDASSPINILMVGQRKGLPMSVAKSQGFKLETTHEAPLNGMHSHYIVDAALFMGRSFRVGWGMNGVFLHTATPVGKAGNMLSSVIHVETVAIDRAVRDEKNKVSEELIDLCFSSPLYLHKSLDHESADEVGHGSSEIKLQKVLVSRLMLTDVCHAYIGILEKQLELSGLTKSARLLLMHQVAIWELIKVLFSERETSGFSQTSIDKVLDDDNADDMILDKKNEAFVVDNEAIPLARRAQFSYWLQDSVCHQVQQEVSRLNDSNYLKHILLLLTGRQLDESVELAASRGDVRLAILLSQLGGSTINRSDMALQLDVWRTNGLDFSFIENDRLRLFNLLAGNIQEAFNDIPLDWKRCLCSVMWYQLPPDTSLPVIVQTYEQLLSEGHVPYPVPVYIDEGPFEEAGKWTAGDRYDIAYYLMLLHANKEKPFDLLKTMFTTFSSTYDPLDYHMIWHLRAILEAIGTFSSHELYALDMGFVSQLLCLGQCHWAIYVVLHMHYHEVYPYLQAKLIKDILFQYCESWSAQESQRQFIEELGIPSAWMHEALAVYSQYYGDPPRALEHFLESSNWQKAHSIFMTSVAHSLFLSSKHSELLRIANIMEDHKSEIADWKLGAGLYIEFYMVKYSLQEENTMCAMDLLEQKNEECNNFFARVNESLLVWGSKLPIVRATFSKMAEELCSLLLSFPGEGSMPAVQMSCFQTMLNAPIPEDLRSSHLQDALSVFTGFLSEVASQ